MAASGKWHGQRQNGATEEVAGPAKVFLKNGFGAKMCSRKCALKGKCCTKCMLMKVASSGRPASGGVCKGNSNGWWYCSGQRGNAVAVWKMLQKR
ncbi:hypothetical protein NPIL_21831 [Nephila pilipes]|uniref:Uncharacterized protein n=1 Tax=Nephila pilipes TaxID=299642 RepID=A0A8X6UQ73_NEPPI|nr:hypothetical protein NPIL_21831 [Nephila pilipes]